MAKLALPEEQDALLGALAALVAARGAEPLLRAPVEPSPRFFPDAWRPDLAGAHAVLRRVMSYAGLADLGCELLAGDGSRTVPDALPRHSRIHTEGAAAWFWGIAEGTAWFGVDRKGLKDPEHLVAALCHEAAHAYRRRYGLEGDAAQEELRTDVTTVFLGFGILTTNATSRMRTSGELQGAVVRHRWSHTSLGYLPPEAMAFLLAAQAVLRRAGWAERRRLAGLLEPNQGHPSPPPAEASGATRRRSCGASEWPMIDGRSRRPSRRSRFANFPPQRPRRPQHPRRQQRPRRRALAGMPGSPCSAFPVRWSRTRDGGSGSLRAGARGPSPPWHGAWECGRPS